MLVTSAKKQRYRGAKIALGDTFDVARKDVRLLKALGWIKDAQQDTATSQQEETPVVEVQEPSPAVEVQEHTPPTPDPAPPAPTVSTTLTYETSDYSRLLREQAERLGIKVDGRWSDARVQREITEHNQNLYQRRDMRAEGSE